MEDLFDDADINCQKDIICPRKYYSMYIFMCSLVKLTLFRTHYRYSLTHTVQLWWNYKKINN